MIRNRCLFILLALVLGGAPWGIQGGEKMLLDFEQDQDLNIWDTPMGRAPSVATENATRGKRSLKVAMDSRLTTSLLPRDWSGFQYLEIDYVNPMLTPVSLYVLIGDVAWLSKKNYWNQFNKFYLLEPGKGSLRIPLDYLFRGQEGKRNIDLPGNIDLASIVRVELEFKGQQGAVYLDAFRLSGEGSRADAPDRVAAAPKAVPPVSPPPAPVLPPKTAPAKPIPPAAPAATRGVVQGKVRILADFESRRDLAMWEQREGWPIKLGKEHVTHGTQSLMVPTGALIVCEALPRDWTGYEAFEFDLYNDSEELYSLEIMIGDDAFMNQMNYWNRFNDFRKVAPGLTTIRYRLDGLYRGETHRRNTMIPRNIDLDSIKQMNIKVTGTGPKGGWAHIDAFRLVGADGSLEAVPAGTGRPAPLPPPRPVPQPAPVFTAPRPAPPPTPARPSSPAASAQDARILVDFESRRDVAMWEQRQGYPIQQSNEHATSGQHSLKVPTGALIVNENLPKDWSGYEALEFDVFNDSKTLYKLEIMIGDDAFMREMNYWNRYNATQSLAPGHTTIRIELDDLYRGEKHRRNTWIPRNIDLNFIRQMNIKILGTDKKGGWAYIDQLRLVRRTSGKAPLPAPKNTTDVAAPSPPSRASPATVSSPPPAVPASSLPPSAAPGPVEILSDVETDLEISHWQKIRGWNHERVGNFVTGGRFSMKVATGTLLENRKLASDWSAFEHFEFDVANDSIEDYQIKLVIGDQAYLQDYSNPLNQFLRVIKIPPGRHTVTIPLAELERGPPGKKNVRLPRNIDLDEVALVQFHLEGLGPKGGWAYFDRFRLTGTPPQKADRPGTAAALRYRHKLLWDIETDEDVSAWESRAGRSPSLADGYASRGNFGLSLKAGDQLYTRQLGGDWQGFEKFEFDAYNTSEHAAHLDLYVYDQAALDHPDTMKPYYARRAFLPGKRITRFDLDAMGKGTGQAGDRSARPLDLANIAAVLLKGVDGELVLDAFRLVTGPTGSHEAQPDPAALSSFIRNASGELRIADFEEENDFNNWVLRYGKMPTIESRLVTNGRQSLKVHTGSLIGTHFLPRDWSAYAALAFDIYNDSDQLLKVEMLIGDQAWREDQNYWNRYNALYMLAPGANTIEIPVSGLYRGEASARNRGAIRRNIDADQIAFLSMNFLPPNAGAELYLDHIRLTPQEETDKAVQLAGGSGAGGDQLIVDFESLRDLARWEIRKGAQPRISDQHASMGTHSLEVFAGNLLATQDIPRDWSRYDSLDLDIYNPTDRLQKMELLIGDEAWIEDQNYWNRHNAIYMLTPGTNTVSIPVGGLYRGEATGRNRGSMRRNIDTDAIVFMSLNFRPDPHGASLFLDNLRLRGKSGAAPKTSIWGFDFGPPDQMLWPGFIPITWSTEYKPETGHGLSTRQRKPSYSGDTTFPSALLQDYVWLEKGSFDVDLPNGTYEVAVFMEESGYWGGEHAKHTRRTFIAEDEIKVTEDRTRQGADGDSLYLLQDVEPRPGVDYLEQVFSILYKPRRFTVEVTDGQLNLEVKANAMFSSRLSGVVVFPAGDADAARWFDDLIQKNIKRARSLTAAMPFNPPRGEEALKQALGDEPLASFVPAVEEDVALTRVPAPGELRREIRLSAARGETVSGTFAVRAVKAAGIPTLSCDGLSGADGQVEPSRIALHAVRHMAKRGYYDRSFQVKPWYLVPPTAIDLEAGLTRQFWISVSVPASTRPGTYRGTVALQTDRGVSQSYPVELQVHPFTLPVPDLAISFFSMPQNALKFLSAYGLTGVNGGPGMAIKGFGKNGQAVIDFRAMDAYMAEAKKAGFTQEMLQYGIAMNLLGASYQDMHGYFSRKGSAAGLTAEQAAARVFKAILEHAKAKNWPPLTFNMVDEPLNVEQVRNLEKSIRFVETAAPEVKTIGYYGFNLEGDRLGCEKLFHLLDGTVTKGYTDEVMALAEREGKDIYLYSLGRRRYIYGPFLFKHRLNGVKGYVQWHSFLVHGYQYFDLDGREPDEGMFVYRTDGIFPTIDLERIRIGINDHRYLLALEQRIAKAAARHPDASSAAQRVMDDLLEPVSVKNRRKPAGMDLDRLRSRLTEQIIALDKVLGDTP